mmetsp:Transcript_117856/g.293955  ORF Transcript_117856/g.293955 Transcript_117856/m.293955 type:complete len:165 (+) Transcript_117856:83-577(+)
MQSKDLHGHSGAAMASAATPPVVFLDVDGVLALGGVLIESCVQRFVRLVLSSDARVILSTSWRAIPAMKQHLLESLVAAGLPQDRVPGQTPFCESGERAEEILAWLEMNPQEHRRWVVLDDLDLSENRKLSGHFFWVDPATGLTDECAEAALASLIDGGMMSRT